MLTLVISLTPKVADLGLAAPFLYPLLASGQVRLVPATLPLDHMDEFIRLEVQHGHVSQWQLFFLLHQDDQITSPEEGSLTATLWQLQRQVLQPLAEHGLHPRQVWLGVMDEVQRLAEDAPEPRQPLAWQRRHLDATGLVTTADFPYLFTRADMEAMRKAWGQPFSLAAYQTDRGLAGLPPEEEQEVRQRLKTLRQQAQEIITRKLNNVPPASGPAATPFTEKGILQTIQEEYEGFLKDLEISPNINWLGTWEAPDALPRLIARHLSFAAVNHNVVLVFCREVGGAPFQRLLLRLVYGIMTAATQPENFFNQDGKILNLQLEWDQEACQQLLAIHQAVLKGGQAQVKATLNAAVAVACEEPDETACVCREVLPTVRLPKITFPWLRQANDTVRWQQWLRDMGEKVAEQTTSADRRLRDCRRDLKPPQAGMAEANLEQLQDFIAAKQGELETARLALLRPEAFACRPPSAFSVSEAEQGALLELINQRPHGWLLVKGLLGATLLAGLPLGLYALSSGGRDEYLRLGEFLGLLLLLTGLGAAAALWRLRRRLATLIGQIHQAAEAQLAAIAQHFANAKEYLQKFCRCQALQQLLGQAQAQAAELDRRLRLSRYHERLLEQHRQNLATLAQILGIALPAPPAQLDFASEVRVEVTLPEERNVVYYPTWTPERIGQVEIPLVIGSQQILVRQPWLRGLKKLVFEDGTDVYLEPRRRLWT